MPFELMDSRGVSASSHFYEDSHFPERQVGFWKSKAMSDRQCSKSVASSPLEKNSAIGTQNMELPETYVVRDLKENLGVSEATKTSWKSLDRPLRSWSNLSMQPESYSLDGMKFDINGTHHESSLFSCSLSEVFSRKMRLPGTILRPPPTKSFAPHYEKEDPVESLEEIEAKTIGNLLPDEEDLFSGMIDDLGYGTNVNSGDDIEDFDLFSSGGGMELEGNDRLCAMQKKSNFIGGVSSGQGVSNGSIVGEHPYGEHPSRTLFVRNINSNVEDSELKSIFEQYGDIRTLYTACKHRGFVMISYYDLRAARNAMRALQNKPLRRRKLDIHYSIPKDNPTEKDINRGILVVFNLESSLSNDELRQLFGIYGEIKEIREIPHKPHHKFIEFCDIRAAETALRALNRIDIAGKQIKLEPNRPGGAKRLVQLSVQEQDESNLSHSPRDNLSSGRIVIISPVVITSGGLNSSSAQTAMWSPANASIDNAFLHQSSSIRNTLSSSMRMAALDSKFDLRESNHSLDEMKFPSQYIPSFHPHSLPEYHDTLANGVPYNSSNIADMAGNVGPRVIEGIDNRHNQKVGSNGHPIEFNGGVFGSSGNGNFPPHGHHYVWSNSNSYQHHPSSPAMWSNSPSFATSVHAQQLQQMPGFPRASPHMLNTASPVHHHVGSAPAVNPSLWDRVHTFSGESPKSSNFHLGSLGNAGFAGGSPLHHMEIASHNIFSHVGGNCLDMTANTGLPPPQQLCHIFPGANPMISMQSSFGSPNERARNLSHRRNEANSNHSDKKQYELDVDRIMCGEDTRTTLMIKNIPNKYTSKMLLAAIDEHCRGSYDFIYLPIDFKNKCNVGYAFINMVDPRKIIPFYQAFNGKKWEKFNSEKVACLAYARIQGKAALIAHFQNSSLMNEDKRCRPILFHTAGPNAGDQEPFPMGSNIRSRPGKPRSSENENNHQGDLFIFPDGEESCNGTDSSSGSVKNSD